LGTQVLNTSKKSENDAKYLAPVLDTSNQEPKKRNGNNTVTKYNILKAPVLNTGEYKMDINTITKEIKKYDLLQAIFCFKEILIQLDYSYDGKEMNPTFFQFIYWFVTIFKLNWIMGSRNQYSTFGGLSTI